MNCFAIMMLMDMGTHGVSAGHRRCITSIVVVGSSWLCIGIVVPCGAPASWGFCACRYDLSVSGATTISLCHPGSIKSANISGMLAEADGSTLTDFFTML